MNKGLKTGLMVVVLLVVVGAMGAGAFYQDEVGGFFRLQGWNTGPVADASRKFVDAASKGDGKTVAGMLAADAPLLEPEKRGDSVVAFKVPAYGGPKRLTLRELCPGSSPAYGSPKLVFLEGGAVVVEARYPKHAVELRWDRKAEGWRLIGVGLNE